MNYQEIAGLAHCGEKWAADLKAKWDADNEFIRAEKQELLDKRGGIRVGDFVKSAAGLQRVAHHWGDCIQLTGPKTHGSCYLGDGFVSYSGGLDPGIDIALFQATDERMEGDVWFFSQNRSMAHNGYYTTATFKVWQLRETVEGG